MTEIKSNLEQLKDIIAAPTKQGKPLIEKIKKCMEEKKMFWSAEFFPPKTREGVQNLFSRMDRFSSMEPAFFDVTWGAGGSTADLTLEISSFAQNFTPTEVMMHLTCTNMPREKIEEALEIAKANGIRNILALRGDPPRGSETWEQCENGFAYAIDLVKFIREKYGNTFGIAVAGYPEGHIQATSLEEDIRHLKAKQDAGADFIVTQLFYDTDLYLNWVQKCRDAGITIPIVPGIMPIQSYSGFVRMTSFCKTSVPREITEALEPMKDDDEAVKQYGVTLAARMCRILLAAGVPGLHFYTLNLERSVTLILENLGFVSLSSTKRISLPWKQSVVARRQKEEVRPIFWANRPHSYLDRTKYWDEYCTNGRWSDSASPAFGELNDYHLYSLKTGTKEERRKIWGRNPTVPKDIFEVFAGFIEGTVARLPWCENPLSLESQYIKEELKKFNRFGLLTINSQPRINGAPSSDPAVGWGPANGYVYQKAYLEFFCSPSVVQKIIKLASQEDGKTPHVPHASSSPESHTRNFHTIAYTAVNVKGEILSNVPYAPNTSERVVNVVTWGVFPNKPVLQPTVVDHDSFLIWKDEAFALWKSQWQCIYEPDSPSYNLIQDIYDNWFLVNVVDNDYINGDLFHFFDDLMDA